MGAHTCHQWVVSDDDLAGMDALRARDLLIECFMAAQRETFVQAKGNLGLPVDEASLKRSVEGAVRGAFRDVGGDYLVPTRHTIEQAIDILAASASAWGTPPDIIEHHHRQIERIVASLPD